MSAKRNSSGAQLSLGIQPDEQSASVVCRGIFSPNYLKQHFTKGGDFPSLDEARPIYEKIKNRWLEEYAGLRTQKEAYTRTEFLDPVLKEIGWTFIPEKELPSKGVTRKRPDYCLFLNDEARQRAAKETDTADVFREATPNFPAVSKETLFVQALPRKSADGKNTKPEKDLPTLKSIGELKFSNATKLAGGAGEVQHGEHGCLRFHRAPSALWRDAHKQVFFEPRPGTLRLFDKFNEPVKKLVSEWWGKIEGSQKFADNHSDISAYYKTLKPGDVTLVGLIAEGGQGLATANNARFLGYLQGTPPAEGIKASREEWTTRWLADAEIKPVFLGLLAQNGGDAAKPTKDVAAWEACVEPLKEKFSLVKLGFTKSDLYRVVLPDLLATPDDFTFALQSRKAELLKIWHKEVALKDFWEGDLGLNFDKAKLDKLRKQVEVSDTEFCELCQELQAWVKERRKPWKTLALRSAENYDDPADAPRIATIYNGFCGHGQFVPFRKGDPEGNRWLDNESLFIDWSRASVDWLSDAREARWQGHKFFFEKGIAFSRHGRDVALKFRLQVPSIFDAASPRLTSDYKGISTEFLLAVLNSFIPTYFIKNLLNNTWYEMSDLRQLPLVMPTRGQEKRLKELAEQAMEAKRLTFAGATPPNKLAASVRALADELAAKAPAYLHPSAQLKLLHTAADCLAVLELAVNWEAEKLYGVEALGPFDEF
jgi:hypothetical protein